MKQRWQLRWGFSLIEVNIAILVAAGGLISLFSLFPGGLRQSVMAQEDLYQATFAASILDAISANVRTIDDPEVWENLEDFWKCAVGQDTFNDNGRRIRVNVSRDLKTAAQMKSQITTGTMTNLFQKAGSGVGYVYVDDEEVNTSLSNNSIIPTETQYLIRVAQFFYQREENSSTQTYEIQENQKAYPGNVQPKKVFPYRYQVSIVSTHMPAPAVFHANVVYFKDFYFTPGF